LLKLFLANENDDPRRLMRRITTLLFRGSDRDPTRTLDKHDVLLETGFGTPLIRSG
jgi:hypothetical protein